MTIYHLHRWSITRDPYKAPEENTMRLSGFRDQDANKITTSIVVEINGREVTTYSGSVYILKDIDLDYLKFLDNIGEIYDWENPIRIKDYL